VVLIGGTSVVDFRVRVAQSHLRQDLLPSYWSLAGVVADRESFWSVPLAVTDPAAVPRNNAVGLCRFADFDDQFRYPNLAVIEFSDRGAEVLGRVETVRTQRSVADLPGVLVSWLGFVWGVGKLGNPLLAGLSLPSAMLVERAHTLAQVTLTPGLTEAVTCPEAIWQSAKWWHAETGPQYPRGFFVLRQPEAAAAAT
jgi:hypothetical protein